MTAPTLGRLTPPYITLYRNFDARQVVTLPLAPGETFKATVAKWLAAQDDATTCDGLTYGIPEEGRYLATLTYNEGMEADDELWSLDAASAGDYGWQTAYYTEETDTWGVICERFAEYVGYCEATSYNPHGEEPDDNERDDERA